MIPVLAGRGILVTRPAHQAEPLCRLLRASGACPIRFPALAIAPPRDRAHSYRSMARLWRFDLVIFVSANAVEHGLAAAGRLPSGPRLAVIGQASARALAMHGYSVDLQPDSGADSEALLASPALQQLAGQRVLIVRGEGGRGTLAETLRARGATVEYADVYRRVRPAGGPRPLLAHWQRGELHAVTAASNETLQNLYEMLAGVHQQLLATPLVVASARARELALALGWGAAATVVAESATDDAMVAALRDLFRGAAQARPV